MASTIDIETFTTNLIALGGDEVSDLSADDAPVLVTTAIQNRYAKIANLCPSVYELNPDNSPSAVLNATAGSQTIDLPSDMELGPSGTFRLYIDIERTVLESERFFRLEGNKLRFRSPQTSTDVYYLEYRKEASIYTAKDDTLDESISPQALQLLYQEVTALHLLKQNDLERSPAVDNSLARANRLN